MEQRLAGLDTEPGYYHEGELSEEEVAEEEEEEMEEDEAEDESSDDEAVDSAVQGDMDRLQSDFPDFRKRYRLIKRIGEGSYNSSFDPACTDLYN